MTRLCLAIGLALLIQDSFAASAPWTSPGLTDPALLAAAPGIWQQDAFLSEIEVAEVLAAAAVATLAVDRDVRERDVAAARVTQLHAPEFWAVRERCGERRSMRLTWSKRFGPGSAQWLSNSGVHKQPPAAKQHGTCPAVQIASRWRPPSLAWKAFVVCSTDAAFARRLCGTHRRARRL